MHNTMVGKKEKLIFPKKKKGYGKSCIKNWNKVAFFGGYTLKNNSLGMTVRRNIYPCISIWRAYCQAVIILSVIWYMPSSYLNELIHQFAGNSTIQSLFCQVYNVTCFYGQFVLFYFFLTKRINHVFPLCLD